MHVALTIAGSDSGGGAGVQADLLTFRHFGVLGTSAITAITAQNQTGIRTWEPVSPALVAAQIDAVAEGYSPTAFKTGMLANAEVAREVRAAITRNRLPNYVLDPVMRSSSGATLLDADGVRFLRDSLLPLASLITPNTDEAGVLLGETIRSGDDAALAAEKLVLMLGAKAALVTGGHLAGNEVIDVLFTNQVRLFRAPRIRARSTHGTGCTLSAGITARIAAGAPLADAVRDAIAHVRSAISSAPTSGKGAGQLAHF